jgi:hypothetical protein
MMRTNEQRSKEHKGARSTNEQRNKGARGTKEQRNKRTKEQGEQRNKGTTRIRILFQNPKSKI